MSYRSATLVQLPLNKNQPDSIYPPLGLLTLAASLLKAGKTVSVVDLNLKCCQSPEWIESALFYDDAVKMLLESGSELIGFSSMAADSHIGMELAREIKNKAPHIDIIMGGSHYSSIAFALIEKYPFIDYVAQGEAEHSLVNLMQRGKRSSSSQLIPGITERTSFGVQFVEAEAIDVNNLEFPAYELVELQEYFNLNPSRSVLYEHARGCNLRCSFCYSPNHWGQGERRKSTSLVIHELKQLSSIGAKNVFFVNDNFLNDWRFAVKLATSISDENLSLSWTCYGTLAQINDQVVSSLAKAGCSGIFIGVDAISASHKKSFSKSYFKDWDALASTLRLCMLNGIEPTCALMLSPDFTKDEIEDVLQTALMISSFGCHVRLNHLAYYNGTELTLKEGKNLEYSEAQPRFLFSTFERVKINKFAQNEPSLFPFHQRYSSETKELENLSLNVTLRFLIQLYLGTLMRYIFEHDGKLYELVKYFASECAALYENYESEASSKIDQLMATHPIMLQYKGLDGIREYELLKRSKNESHSKIVTVTNIRTEREYKFYDPETISLPCEPDQITCPSRLQDYGLNREYYLPRSNVKSKLLEKSLPNIQLIRKFREGESNVEMNHNMIGTLERTGLLRRHFL